MIWGEEGGDLKLTLEYRGAKVPGSANCKVELFDNNVPGAPPLKLKTFYPVYEITQDFANLPKGQYLLRATATKINSAPGGNPPFDQAFISLSWKSRVYTTETLKKKKAGGVRIWVVRNFSYVGDPNPIYKHYVYDDGVTPLKTSSGVLKEMPFYESLNLRYYAAGETACNYDLRIAQNRSMLGYGNHIGYGKVTELSGYDGGNGKTVYSFTTEKDYPAASFKLPPFQQSSVNTYATGNSLGAAIFRRENQLFKPVNEQATTQTEIQAATTVNGWKIRFDGGTNAASKFTKGTYETRIGEWYPIHTIEKEYASDAINYQQQEKELVHYGKLLRKERLMRNRNAAGYEETAYYYPGDFSNPTAALQNMISKNMVGLPIEIVKSIPDVFSNIVTYATFNNYSLDASSRVFLSEIKKLQRATPGSFLPASSLPAGIVDGNYATETLFEKYDDKENLVQSTGKDGITRSLLYDKHMDAPAVAANGAGWDKMAWSGFENTDPLTFGGAWTLNGTYNSTDAMTGKRSFSGTINVNTASFPATSYVLSFWMKGSTAFLVNGVQVTPGSSWTLYETKINGNSSIAINTQGGLIDELRFYPPEAQMVTTSYDQFIGPNCVSDQKSSPVFYEYDNLWRLHLVKDRNKDIVKRTNYEFEILAPLAYTLNVTQTGNYAYQLQVVGGVAGYIYEFDFDDLTSISGTAATVSHTFPSLTLTYNVKVKIKNSVNTLATLVKEVTVQKSTGSTACSEIQGINVSRSISNPKQITFSVPSVSGVSYWWEFGDNTTDNTASTTHTYPSAANVVNYQVMLTVSAGGKACTSKTNIKINP